MTVEDKAAELGGLAAEVLTAANAGCLSPSAWPACDCSECTHLTLWTSLFPLHSGNGHSASLSVSGAGGLHSVLVIINYCLFVWSLHTQCLGSGT